MNIRKSLENQIIKAIAMALETTNEKMDELTNLVRTHLQDKEELLIQIDSMRESYLKKLNALLQKNYNNETSPKEAFIKDFNNLKNAFKNAKNQISNTIFEKKLFETIQEAQNISSEWKQAKIELEKFREKLKITYNYHNENLENLNLNSNSKALDVFLSEVHSIGLKFKTRNLDKIVPNSNIEKDINKDIEKIKAPLSEIYTDKNKIIEQTKILKIEEVILEAKSKIIAMQKEIMETNWELGLGGKVVSINYLGGTSIKNRIGQHMNEILKAIHKNQDGSGNLKLDNVLDLVNETIAIIRHRQAQKKEEKNGFKLFNFAHPKMDKFYMDQLTILESLQQKLALQEIEVDQVKPKKASPAHS